MEANAPQDARRNPPLLLDEEGSPPYYRRIALDGSPLYDAEPWDRAESDQEPEHTCIDALTLQLRHQTTDIYVPLLRTDFSLAVRRNIRGAAWLNGAGLSPVARPDLPFGNCWSSGIAASLHLIEPGPGALPILWLTDEQGTRHKFVAFIGPDGRDVYQPLPTAEHGQEAACLRLTRTANEAWLFQRKFGTTLLYSAASTISLSLPGAPFGLTERHSYYRLASVEDACGSRIEYLFHSENRGLIADEIFFKSRRIRIQRNDTGCVHRIIDPLGREFFYHYRAAALPGGAPLLIGIDRPLIVSGKSGPTFEYDEAPEPDRRKPGEAAAFHTNLSRMEGWGEVWSPAAGMPRSLRRIILPDEIGVSQFFNYSEIYGDPNRLSHRTTFVSDAVGHGRIYRFEGPCVTGLCDLPRGQSGDPVSIAPWAPRIAVFRSLEVTHCRGSRHRLSKPWNQVRPVWPSKAIACERYHFEASAGMALVKAIDLSGNVIEFFYEEALKPSTGLSWDVARWHGRPTARVAPGGEARRFRFDPSHHRLIEREDELGRVTVFTCEAVRGLRVAEATYVNREARDRNEPFAVSELAYDDPRFPGFVTRKIVRKLPCAEPGPAWEQDLVSVFEADELGEIAVEIRDPGGLNRVTRFAYDLSTNKLSVAHPNGYLTQFRYDELNHLTRVYRPGQPAKRNEYDLLGNKIREVESDGTVTLFEYDAFGRRLRRFSGEDAASEIKKQRPRRYNAVGSILFDPDVKGESQTRVFDALQRTVKLRCGSGRIVGYGYARNCGSLLFDWCSFHSTSAHRRGSVSPTSWKYDAAYRCLEVQVFGASPSYSQYDAVGNLIIEIDADGGWTRHEYDALDRRIKTTLPGGAILRTLYTSTGLEYGTITGDGRLVERQYDAAGELIEEK